MNKPRPIYNKDGELTGYKQEVKWRNQRRYFTRRTAAAAEKAWANAIADFEAGREPYDRYKLERPGGTEAGEGVEGVEQEPTAETFGEYLARWHPTRRLTPRARRNQTIYLDARIIPDLGHLRLTADEMTKPRIQGWVWGLEEEYAPRYVRTLLGVVRVALLDAVDDPVVPLDATPVVRIRMEPVESTGRVALTPEQVAAVASRCGVHETLVWSLAFTGCRIGELLARDVSDWSWRTGITIAGRPVEPAMEDGERPRKRKKGVKKGAASKTPAGARTIPLCAGHSGMLRDYVDGRSDGPLFRGGRGGRAGRATYFAVYETMVAAVEAAREAGADLPPGKISPHWLRKTHKTWIREAKCDPRAIDERIGHASQGMDALYVDVTPAMRREIVAALDPRWALAMAAPKRLRRSA